MPSVTISLSDPDEPDWVSSDPDLVIPLRAALAADVTVGDAGRVVDGLRSIGAGSWADRLGDEHGRDSTVIVTFEADPLH